jgi:hypothetical protein
MIRSNSKMPQSKYMTCFNAYSPPKPVTMQKVANLTSRVISYQAMVSVLCCGPCFDDAITEDETLYSFLDSLLEYDDPKVNKISLLRSSFLTFLNLS